MNEQLYSSDKQERRQEVFKAVLKNKATRSKWILMYTQEDGLELLERPTFYGYKLAGPRWGNFDIAKDLYEKGIDLIIALYTTEETTSIRLNIKRETWEYAKGFMTCRRHQERVVKG